MNFRLACIVASALTSATLSACAGTTTTPPPSPAGIASDSLPGGRSADATANTNITPPATNSSVPTSATVDNHKPTAPINLGLIAAPVANKAALFNVTLLATAQADLDDVVVAIDGQNHYIGAMRNRAVNTVTSTVELGGKPGRDIIGTAQLVVHGRKMTKATALRLGAPAAPPPPAATVTLPDGTVVNEAR